MRLLGIPVRIHFTFVLLVVLVGYVSARQSGSPWRGLVFLLLLFGSVLLHELGHALAARRFGVATREIVLYPIGGVARLEGIATGRTELCIALAGPATNLAIAGLAVGLGAAAGLSWPSAEEVVRGDALLAQLVVSNLVLFFFNLVPAFPMDGGRVLRSLLSFVVDEGMATLVASRVGQAFAVAFALVAVLFRYPILLFVALFVFFGAGQELSFYRARTALAGYRVRDAMLREFRTVMPQEAVARVAELSLRTGQRDFPVIDGWGRVQGVLRRDHLAATIASDTRDAAVLEVMDRVLATLTPQDLLAEILPTLEAGSPQLVMDEEKLVGMLDLEHLSRVAPLLGAGSEMSDEAGAQEVQPPAIEHDERDRGHG